MGRTACTEPQCLYKGALYLTSVPVQGCTLPFLMHYNLRMTKDDRIDRFYYIKVELLMTRIGSLKTLYRSFATTVSQHNSVTTQQCHNTAVSQHNSVTTQVSQHNTVTTQQCHNTTLSQHNSVTTQQCHNTTVSQHNSVTTQNVRFFSRNV